MFGNYQVEQREDSGYFRTIIGCRSIEVNAMMIVANNYAQRNGKDYRVVDRETGAVVYQTNNVDWLREGF